MALIPETRFTSIKPCGGTGALVKKSGGPFDQPSVLTNQNRPKHNKGIVQKEVRPYFSNFSHCDCGLAIQVREESEMLMTSELRQFARGEEPPYEAA